MIIELKVKQISSLGQNMVRLILARPGLRSRIEPLHKTQEQKMAQDIMKNMQQALGGMFPGGVTISGPHGPSGMGDLKIDMQITEEEYGQMGRPGINDIIRIEVQKDSKPPHIDE